MIVTGNKPAPRKKRMCIKISKILLEDFLFQNLEQALKAIKEAITECPPDQND